MTIPNQAEQTASNELIELRFTGGGINPRTVRASDVADMLNAAESLIVAAVLQEHNKLKKDDIILGLTEVQDRSLGLRFTPSIPHVVIPVFERLTATISDGFFESLPSDAREALRKIATFTRKNRCIAEFKIGTQGATLATVDSNLVVPSAPRVQMRTTLYGRVMNAGGKSPNIHLETLEEVQIVCKGTQAQVKQLASRLYTVIGVSGTAWCDTETLEIADFEIEEILPYEGVSFLDSIHELAELAAPHFDGIDADVFVRSLRDDDTEE